MFIAGLLAKIQLEFYLYENVFVLLSFFISIEFWVDSVAVVLVWLIIN